MRKVTFILVGVLLLLLMALPSGISEVLGQISSNRTVINQTAINGTDESPLIADFDYSVCPFCSTAAHIGVTFSDLSTGGVGRYGHKWDFGDGSTSRVENPVHYYSSTGNYTVTLTVNDRARTAASTSQTIILEAGASTAAVGGNSSIKAPTTPEWPRCIDGCTANDVEINSVTLDVPAGNYTLGETVTGDVYMSLYFHRQNTFCIVVVADLYQGGVLEQTNWVSNIISYHSGSGSQTYLMGTIDWAYGMLFEMRNVLVMWDVNAPAGGTCPTDCSNYISSKCSQPGDIIITTPLVVDFGFDTVCYCNNTVFTDTTTGGKPPYTYSWDFGGGYTYSGDDPTTLQNPAIHYDAAGTYTVTLTVTDSDSSPQVESKSHDVVVYEGPTADFSADVTNCCAPLEVQFTDESVAGDNPIDSWYWEFGDGDTSTGQNPTHTFDPGTYTVSLTVTDEHGCSDTATKESYITSNEGPTADFSADVTSCCAPLEVQFTDESVAGDNPIDSWYWEFGDGDTSTEQNPTHTFDPGTYTVSLTVTDEHGCSDTATKESYITSNEGPTADFSADVTSCCAPLEVQFTDESVAGDNPIDSWYWEFGDGDTSTEQNPTHTFDPGTYTVSLTVTDEHGCSDTATKESYITSNEPPIADFSATPAGGTAPLLVQFTDDSVAGTNPIVSWYWEFGDGDTSTEQNPSHTYTSVGTYSVTLTVTDEHGCSDDATGTISVSLPPPPPPAGPAGCPTTRYLTVDWEGNNTTKPLYSNGKLAVDLLGPSPNLASNLFLERATHAPVVGATTYYLITVRQMENYPTLPANTQAIVVYNVTPTGSVFNKDLLLTLGLTDAQLPATGNVTMEYYDDVNHVWVPLDFEAGGGNGVAALTLSAPITHFSIYGVLAQASDAPVAPAHFVPSGLNIETRVQRIWAPVTFVTRTGQTVTITANVFNDGYQQGTFTATLKLNGQIVDTKTITLGAGQSTQVTFIESGLAYGQYDVEVAGLTGEFTASRTITWWLIAVIVVALGLIIWGIACGRRRRRAHQAQ